MLLNKLTNEYLGLQAGHRGSAFLPSGLDSTDRATASEHKPWKADGVGPGQAEDRSCADELRAQSAAASGGGGRPEWAEMYA